MNCEKGSVFRSTATTWDGTVLSKLNLPPGHKNSGLRLDKTKRDCKYRNSFKNYCISRFMSINMTHPLLNFFYLITKCE
jgi:hypothetical protein